MQTSCMTFQQAHKVVAKIYDLALKRNVSQTTPAVVASAPGTSEKQLGKAMKRVAAMPAATIALTTPRENVLRALRLRTINRVGVFPQDLVDAFLFSEPGYPRHPLVDLTSIPQTLVGGKPRASLDLPEIPTSQFRDQVLSAYYETQAARQLAGGLQVRKIEQEMYPVGEERIFLLLELAGQVGNRLTNQLLGLDQLEPTQQAETLRVFTDIRASRSFFFGRPAIYVRFENIFKPQFENWLQTRSAGEKFQILSLGSSLGEEPYTVAMLIAKVMIENYEKWQIADPASRVSITALDRLYFDSFTHRFVQEAHYPAFVSAEIPPPSCQSLWVAMVYGIKGQGKLQLEQSHKAW